MASRFESFVETSRAIPVRTLDAILQTMDVEEAVARADLRLGDSVMVTTRNSTYDIRFLAVDLFSVSGGWFDSNGPSPVRLNINGCTWGGSAIRQDIVAAPGLFLEFANGVKTTRIRKVEVVRWSQPDTCH